MSFWRGAGLVSDGISFVLHAPADEAYASALASQIGALPLSLEPAASVSLQFGAGVVCVVVWSEAVAAQSEALLRALSASVVVVVWPDTAALPAAWSAFESIDSSVPVEDAVKIAARTTGHRVATFDRSAQLHGATESRPPLAARSAYGMAATFAVASLVTPFIMERAQATDAGGVQPPTAPAQGAGLLRASLEALSGQPEVQLAASPTPALDNWLAPTEDAQPVPVLAAHTRDAAPLELTELAEPMYDPKRAAFAAAALAASSEDGSQGFEPLGSAKHNA